jgi:hypothetical protein
MKVKWGKLGKRGPQQCTGGTMKKTKKKSLSAKKKAISRSRIWLAYASPVTNHNYTDRVLRLKFTKTHNPHQELLECSFEECFAAALLVRYNQTPPTPKRETPPTPSASQSPAQGKQRCA